MEWKGFIIFLVILATAAYSVQANECRDAISGCQWYADSSCRAPYINWALRSCKRRCNLCNYVPPGTGTSCVDKALNCADFIVGYTSFCQGRFKVFARNRCARSCNLCSEPSSGMGTSMGMAAPMGMAASMRKEITEIAIVDEPCEDKLDTCESYHDSACELANWSVTNCKKRCNLCAKTPGTCVDKVSDCHPVMCQGFFKDWARQYCPVTCNFCNVSTNSTLAPQKSKFSVPDSTTPVQPSASKSPKPVSKTSLPPAIKSPNSVSKTSLPPAIKSPKPVSETSLPPAIKSPKPVSKTSLPPAIKSPKPVSKTSLPPAIKLPKPVSTAPVQPPASKSPRHVFKKSVPQSSTSPKPVSKTSVRPAGKSPKPVSITPAQPPASKSPKPVSKTALPSVGKYPEVVSKSPVQPTEVVPLGVTLVPKSNWDMKTRFPRRTLLPPMCGNLRGDCNSFPDSKCHDYMWAIPNCKERCNICGAVSKTCEDKTADCSRFGSALRCDGYFRYWAKQFCPKQCGYCKN